MCSNKKCWHFLSWFYLPHSKRMIRVKKKRSKGQKVGSSQVALMYQIKTATCIKYWDNMTIWILMQNSHHNFCFNLLNNSTHICGHFMLSHNWRNTQSTCCWHKTDHPCLKLYHYLRASHQVQTLPLCKWWSPAAHITLLNPTSWTG